MGGDGKIVAKGKLDSHFARQIVNSLVALLKWWLCSDLRLRDVTTFLDVR
jgi:hypothetical protein